MEKRITLTGNIIITNALVDNADIQPLTTVNVGEWVYIQAEFTTQNLPSNASYRVAFTVNGLTIYSVHGDWGAGQQTGFGNPCWGQFSTSAGTNYVTVTVDPDHSLGLSSYADTTFSFTFDAVSPAVGYPCYTAAQIRSAYGINSIPDFGTATADGSGQTIAIVDYGNFPDVFSDLDGFDTWMSLAPQSAESLYQLYGPASSFLSVYNQYGTNITPDIETSGADGVPAEADIDGQGETALDVNWAHAIAPGAKIDLVETNWNGVLPQVTDFIAGNSTAASLPDVSVVSDSWGFYEWSGESAYDLSSFVTPSGHTGVTFTTSGGDTGEGTYYPAVSPNVVVVGGTQLSVQNDGYGSEIGWSFPSPRTLDNQGSSYSQTGSWSSQSGGFSGTYSTAPGGSSSSAVWTTSISSADEGVHGAIEVSATWTASRNNTSDATYTIYDGTESSGTVLGTVVVDQQKVPVGTVNGSFQFQELGTYASKSGILTVVLSAKSATGTVVADAIGIAPGDAGGGGQSNSNRSRHTNSHSRAPDSAQVPTCPGTHRRTAE